MKKTPLSQWLEQTGVSQQALGAMTGVGQAAISKMLRSGREIYVVIDDKRVYLEETRRIGSAA